MSMWHSIAANFRLCLCFCLCFCRRRFSLNKDKGNISFEREVDKKKVPLTSYNKMTVGTFVPKVVFSFVVFMMTNYVP